MENRNGDSSTVSVLTDEYFRFKTEELRDEIEEEVGRKTRNSLLIGAGVLVGIMVVGYTIYFSSPQSELYRERAMEYSRLAIERSKESEYLLEKALQKLELNTRESENLVSEIQLLKKEVLALKLRVENLELRAAPDTQS